MCKRRRAGEGDGWTLKNNVIVIKICSRAEPKKTTHAHPKRVHAWKWLTMRAHLLINYNCKPYKGGECQQGKKCQCHDWNVLRAESIKCLQELKKLDRETVPPIELVNRCFRLQALVLVRNNCKDLTYSLGSDDLDPAYPSHYL